MEAAAGASSTVSPETASCAAEATAWAITVSPKIGEGRITIRSTRENGHTIIDVIDNGVGVSANHVNRVNAGGIGLRNVNERLRVIYGANYQLQLDSVPGEGTCARIVIPELIVPARITA